MTSLDKTKGKAVTSRGAAASKGSPWYTMGPVLAVGFCIGASQNIMAPHLTSIAQSFGLNNNERDIILGGWMSTAFFIVGGPASLLVGTLADRVNRRQLVLLLAIVGALTIFTTSIAFAIYQLLILRVVLGAVYGSLNPVFFSLVGDLFPPASRPSLASLVSLAIGGGTAVGQIVSGAAGGIGWRIPYMVIAVLCCSAGVLVWMFAVEPVRGAADKEASQHKGTQGEHITPTSVASNAHDKSVSMHELKEQLVMSVSSLRLQLKRALAIKTNQLIFLQGIFGTIPWSVITVFLPDFLAQEQGFAVPHATFLVMLFGIGAAVGGVVGGSILGNKLYRRGSAYVPAVFGVLQACSALPMLWIINMQPKSEMEAGGEAGAERGSAVYLVAFTAGLFAAMTGPNLKAMLMNVNTPQTRGAVFTFANISDSVSKGFAPYLLGLMISATGWSRATVFTVAMLGWVISGAMIGSVTFVIVKDEEMAKARAGNPTSPGPISSPAGKTAKVQQ